MPTKEQYLTLEFPTKGLDLNDEFEEQPPGTTAVGNNVRARDVLQQRLRGGSRPGLVKYIAQQIPEGTTVIQHLDYIVDPSEAALTQNFETPDSTWIEISPGVWVPPGGAGWQPNPNVNQPQTNITFVQGKRQKFDFGSAEQSVAFAIGPTVNRTIFAFIGTGNATTAGITVTVKNGAGSPTGWSQVGSYIEILNPVGGSGAQMVLSCWKKTVSDANDQTVKVQPSASSELAIVILEYAGAPTTSQVDTVVTNSDNSLSPPAPATTGNVAILGAKEALLGAFLTNYDISNFTPGAGFTCRPSADNGTDSGPVPEFRLNVVEKVGLNFPGDNPTAATGTTTGGEDPYVAIGVSVKKG